MPSKGCIVIVEPDDLIRELLERWLGEAEYHAVPVAKNHAMPMVVPRLVITDISEPASARNKIEALEAAYAAPILALSARFRRGLGGSSEPAQRLRVAKVLPKPFTRQQLLRAVRETLRVGERLTASATMLETRARATQSKRLRRSRHDRTF